MNSIIMINTIIEKRITPQQLQILNLLLEKGQVTTKDIVERVNISKQSIGDKISLMMAKSLIVREIGDNRIYHFKLTPEIKEKFSF